MLSQLLLSKLLFKFSFSKFSQALSQIQQKSGNIIKVELLSQFLRSIGQNQKCQCQKLFNFIHQKTPTGISNKLLITHCTKLLSQSKIQQQTLNKATVELIEKFIPKEKPQSSIKILNVNQMISKIIQTKGKNSVEIKINLIIQMLTQMSFLQSRYLLRILTKDLKIGMKKKLVDKAFVQSSGLIFGQEKFTSFIPMLSSPIHDMKDLQKFCSKKQGQIMADIKYDGQRTLIRYQKGVSLELISRNGRQQNQKYYKIVQQVQFVLDSMQGLNDIVLDGEIIAINKETKQPLPFQVLLTRRKKIDSPKKDDQKVQQIVQIFDILSLNGQDLLQIPLMDRKNLIFEKGNLRKAQFQVFQFPEEINKLMYYFQKAISNKYQGLILKGLFDKYVTSGSRVHWAKIKKGFKQFQTDKGMIDLDLVVMGADFGKGKKIKVLSSFLLGTKHDGKYVPIAKVGSGFSDLQLQHLTQQYLKLQSQFSDSSYLIPQSVNMDVWLPPFQVMQIQCQQYSRSPLYRLGFIQGIGGVSVRFPIFKRLRPDKNVEEVTNGKFIYRQMLRQEGTKV